jgi:hypothetical protein
MAHAHVGPEPEELYIDEYEPDRQVLLYLLIRDTEMDPDELYSIVFGEGSTITWH